MYVGVVDEARTRELRRSVLRPNLAPGDRLPGDELADGVHLAVVADDGTVLCTCFVYPDPCPWLPERAGSWHLRQMATLPTHRGQGLGAAVVRAAVDHVRAHGGELLWCNARETAVGFYRRQGFAIHGDVFADERHTIPHRRMWRELRAPATSSPSPRRSAGA
jgi:GNAT superfamily N-acetyltransferase